MSPTRIVVAGALGITLVWVAYVLMGWQWASVVAAALGYEAWTIANRYEHDTISDIVRDFSRKQLLTPWLFGFAFGVGVATGYISDIYVAIALAVLQGHFFFTLNEKREEAIKQEAKAEVRADIAQGNG